MSKIINISDKFSKEKPCIQIGDKEYPVNDSMSTVMKFEELAGSNSSEKMFEAIEVALGKEASEALNVREISVANFKIVTIAILAAMQGLTYDEAEARFPK